MQKFYSVASVMDDYVIKTENLSKTYGFWLWKKKEPSLDNLNLAIPRGTVFGFLGPNGAGKTTTIRLLMDLIKPTTGTATVLGRSTVDVDVKYKIGFLPDAPAFSSYLTAYEFLNICGKLLKIPSGERKKRIGEVLADVKMEQHAKAKLGSFSRGMIQRIGIAQAILNKPELLVLDEPLVGLDPHGRQELKDIINAQRKSGTNVFFCSHILSDVEKICDHIGILHKGKLLCYGALDNLLTQTGMRVSVKQGNDERVKELLTDAVNSSRTEDGGWNLLFPDKEPIRVKLDELKHELPEVVDITPSRENLETFFFRTIENSEKESGS